MSKNTFNKNEFYNTNRAFNRFNDVFVKYLLTKENHKKFLLDLINAVFDDCPPDCLKGKIIDLTLEDRELTVMHEKETKELETYLKALEQVKADAIIVSDPAIIAFAKKHTSLELHVSTQQSTLNYLGASFLKKIGASRIVLAREATKEDISDIMKHVPIEIETFIHGAMCASFSGRCVLSNYFTARDSNRGGCSQICRWDFDLLEY